MAAVCQLQYVMEELDRETCVFKEISTLKVGLLAGSVKMFVDPSRIVFRFHYTWCHIPNTGILEFRLRILALDLG
jgi:hypothetical protein